MVEIILFEQWVVPSVRINYPCAAFTGCQIYTGHTHRKLMSVPD